METNRIAVIGGTGKSGAYLVDRLVENQFKLRVLVRDPKRIRAHPSIEILVGDARNYDSIARLIIGCDSIISTLGQPRGESSIFSEATRNVVQAMNETGIDRYIVTTGLSVNTPFDKKEPRVQLATDWMYQNFPETTKDKQVEYDFLSVSEVRWTMVRLPLIVESHERFPTQVNLENCHGERIISSDLADFLVNQLLDTTYIQKCPFLYNV